MLAENTENASEKKSKFEPKASRACGVASVRSEMTGLPPSGERWPRYSFCYQKNRPTKKKSIESQNCRNHDPGKIKKYVEKSKRAKGIGLSSDG